MSLKSDQLEILFNVYILWAYTLLFLYFQPTETFKNNDSEAV